MVAVTINRDQLHLEILGWSCLFALKRHLDIPLKAIKRVSVGHVPKFRWGDIRVLGTSIPGVLAAGTFLMGAPRRRALVDIRKRSTQVLDLELEEQPYQSVIAEVRDAETSCRSIESAIQTIPAP